jgi:hypothetical protein
MFDMYVSRFLYATTFVPTIFIIHIPVPINVHSRIILMECSENNTFSSCKECPFKFIMIKLL